VLVLLFMLDRVPAWHTNRLNRLTRSPKRYVTDAALLAPLLGVDARGVLRDGELLGRVIDTFVLSQLRPEAEASDRGVTISHLRLDDGRHEIDLVAQAADGRVIGIEVKSASAPTAADARHLLWLRDELGDMFRAGIVFHTGPRPYQLDERVHALPIAAIWGPRGA
jgi:predicted AAA+ superfamily ATPase